MVSYVIALYIYMWEQGVPGMPVVNWAFQVAGTGRSWYADNTWGIDHSGILCASLHYLSIILLLYCFSEWGSYYLPPDNFHLMAILNVHSDTPSSVSTLITPSLYLSPHLLSLPPSFPRQGDKGTDQEADSWGVELWGRGRESQYWRKSSSIWSRANRSNSCCSCGNSQTFLF